MGAILFGWPGWLAEMDYSQISTSIVDVVVVAFVIYKLLMLVKGTRAWQIMWGLGVFFLLVFVSDWLHLRALNWLLRIFLPLGPVALVLLFYPELRNALEEVGRLKFLGRGFIPLEREDVTNLVDELTRVTADMSRAKVGALMVLERDVGLDNIITNGTTINAAASAELLRTIFHPGGPLHDGAVVIRGDRIVAASCTLPLSDNPRFGTMIHTRHKAALGLAEQSDAVVIVVSEETGTISLSIGGELLRGLTPEQVRAELLDLFEVNSDRAGRFHIGRTVSSAFSRMGLGGTAEGRRRS